jgi:hypothetical protein
MRSFSGREVWWRGGKQQYDLGHRESKIQDLEGKNWEKQNEEVVLYRGTEEETLL